MTESTQSTGPLVGFLVVENTAKGDGFIGALLVTDGRGYPLEFRATTPIRPSLVQKTLWGAKLEHYVGVELCGKTLLKGSQRKPKVVLVPRRDLLDAGGELGVDIVATWRAGEALHVEADRETTNDARRGSLNPPGSPYKPLVYEGRFGGPEREREVVPHLLDYSTRFDLVEAFDRMRSALTLLAKEDPRYA